MLLAEYWTIPFSSKRMLSEIDYLSDNDNLSKLILLDIEKQWENLLYSEMELYLMWRSNAAPSHIYSLPWSVNVMP